MKHIKKIMCFILMLSIIFVNMIDVNASSGSFEGFELTGTWNQYTAWVNTSETDRQLMPSSGFYYWYKKSDGTVIYLNRGDVLSDIVTRQIGIVMEPTRLATFISGYSAWLANDPNYYNTLVPVLNGSAMVGVALNSLVGGRMAIPSSTDNSNVEIPASEVNNVYNYYQYFIVNEGAFAPDYITIIGTTKQNLVGNLSTNLTNFSNYERCLNYFDSYLGIIDSYSSSFYWDKTNSIVSAANNAKLSKPKDNSVLVGLTTNAAAQLGLDASKSTITWDEMLTKEFTLNITCKDKDTYSNLKWDTYNVSGTSAESSYYAYNLYGTNSSLYVCVGTFTIWKDTNVINQIKNNTYNAPQYTTNNYIQPSPNNPNPYNQPYVTSPNQVNNATTNNSTVYNNSNTSNNTNITEQITETTNNYSTVDNSSIVTNTTTIVNNYYNTTYPENDPDNGNDDPSGGGGSDLEDDSILDALLAAILKLLRAIGKIIATILTGIIEIITDVLAAIANITTAFTGIIDFIASIFGFLPSECIAVLTLGLTLSVLIALLKMFGK